MRPDMHGRRDRVRALGPMVDMPAELRRACEPDAAFEPIPDPAPHDWLATHDEQGQTFEQFCSTESKIDPAASRVYLQPFDDLPPSASPCLEAVASFCRAFFCLEVSVLPPLTLDARAAATRIDWQSGAPQTYAGDLLVGLAAAGRPADALCVMGVTLRDLYPHAVVNFAFGEASEQRRVGVFSMARFGPPYCDQSRQAVREVLTRRCCRVVAHEICHIIGIQHCIYYRCLMNGSADMAESDRRPLHICPVDLRKLHWAIHFDIVERYRRLQRFWHDTGYDDEVRWIERRLPHVQFGWRRLSGHPERRVDET